MIIVEQVRSIRKEIEQQYPDASSYQYLEQVEKTCRKRPVRRGPKGTPRTQAS
jgi:hypothetical protein